MGWSRAASERGARVWAGARLGLGREGGPGPLRGRGKGRLDWAVGWERAQSEKREVRAEGVGRARAEGAWWADCAGFGFGLPFLFLLPILVSISNSNKSI